MTQAGRRLQLRFDTNANGLRRGARFLRSTRDSCDRSQGASLPPFLLFEPAVRVDCGLVLLDIREVGAAEVGAFKVA